MNMRTFMGSFLILGALLAACSQGSSQPGAGTLSPQGTVAPQPTSIPKDLPPAAIAAKKALAGQLGVDPAQILVQSAEKVDWPNGCLGLPGKDEMCTQMVTPGYRGILAVKHSQYEYHTDASGSQVRFISAGALGARQVLAQQLQLDPKDITVISSESVQWPDQCLGVEIKGMTCAQSVTPGYRVMLQANGKQYEYHTNESGSAAVLASAPQVSSQDTVLTWTHQGTVCETAQISSQSVAFGGCGNALMEGKFVASARVDDLAYFVKTYAAFDADTPAGKVTFKGQGDRQATPVEQRMIAEWAHLIFVEGAGGRSGATYGLAFAWHREGGIAGFCDDLSVYVSGEVDATSCKSPTPSNPARARLSVDQLTQVYAWVDSFKNFEVSQKDPATADAMTIRMVFSGNGQKDATQADQQAVLDFASSLYADVLRSNPSGAGQVTPAQP
ncbi:MAG TPA: hypothetical protein VF498_15380 [Anaerolineales bacterium]